MNVLRFGFLFAVGGTWAAATGLAQIPPGYEVIQVTQNPYWEDRPRINNKGQVVFYARLGDVETTEEIFLYDQGELIRLTRDDVRDTSPDINDGGTIVWVRGWKEDAEIVLYENGELRQLTDNDNQDGQPRINNLGHVAWMRYGPPGCNGWETFDIYFYDGNETQRVTYNGERDSLFNQGVDLNDLDQMVWTEYDFCRNPWDSRIMMYDNGVITPLTSYQFSPQRATINNLGQVAWFYRRLSDMADVLEVWENGETRVLTEWGSGPTLNNRGDIAFHRWRRDLNVWEQWVYLDQEFRRLADDPIWNRSGAINDWGEVVWVSSEFPIGDIRLMRLSENVGESAKPKRRGPNRVQRIPP